MKGRIEFATALLLQIIGAGTVLLVATREWQTITAAQAAPFGRLVLKISGRTVDGSSFAFALVGLAGVVAVLATNGVVRRVIGALVAIAGLALIWRSAAALPAVSAARAHTFVRARAHVLDSSAVAPHVVTHPVWAVLSCVGGLLVTGAGAAIAIRGGRWAVMSARYEAPERAHVADAEQDRAKADASLWRALELGEDPTVRDPRDAG